MLVLMFKYNYVLYSGVKDFVKSNKAITILELQDEVLGEYLAKSLIYIRAIYQRVLTKKQGRRENIEPTLDSGIDVAPGINIAPGTFGKNIKHSPYTPLRTPGISGLKSQILKPLFLSKI